MMSTSTKTRRLPVKICVHPGGMTEIFYSADPLSQIPAKTDFPVPAVRKPSPSPTGTLGRWLTTFPLFGMKNATP